MLDRFRRRRIRSVVTTSSTWAVLIPVVLHVLFLIGLAIFVVTRPSDGTSAKTYALCAIGILGTHAVASLTDVVIMAFEAQQNPYTYVSSEISTMSLVTLLLSEFALCLLVVAAFTGRKSVKPQSGHSDSRLTDNNNPYQPPSN